MLRVLIVDDTRLYLEGLASILEHQSQIAVVQTAADQETALRHVTSFSPDVVLLNTVMNGSGAILQTLIEAERIPVIALSVREAEHEVVSWAEAGVAGYLFRTESLADLLVVLQSVQRGETVYSPRVAAALLRRVATLASERGPQTDVARLTGREHQVLRLIDEGLTNKDIARRLSIEVRTVKNHVHNILNKLQVHRRSEAAAKIRLEGNRDRIWYRA
jgi:two-component system nitrate/nitrite response regulator NarL